MSLYIGRVSKVVDSKKFIIRATVSGKIEDVLAYPDDVYDEPEVGEEIILKEIESQFGFSYIFTKARLFNFTRLKFNDCLIQLSESGISVRTKNGLDIAVNSDGDIDIKATDTVTIKAKTINIKAEDRLSVEARDIVLPAGTVRPSMTGGPFNAIKICPYTGQPHQGYSVQK